MSGESAGTSKNIGIIAAVVGAVALFAWSWKINMAEAAVELGYYCLSCKQTEDIAEYQANWRQYRGALSDSVLVCVKCNKGPAHPTNECKTCGAVFILHLSPKYNEYGDPSCPKCDAAYGETAKARGYDLMPKALNP